MDTKKLKVLIIEGTYLGAPIDNAFFEKGMGVLVSRIDRAANFEEAQASFDLNAYHMIICLGGGNLRNYRQALRGKGITVPLFSLVEQLPLATELSEMLHDEESMVFPLAALNPALCYLMARFARLHQKNREMQRQLVLRIPPGVEGSRLQLRELSLFRDSLTGLYNRAYFLDKLAQLDTAEQRPLSLILGDMNGLALINDAFGYTEGDRLLRDVAKALQKCCGSEDIIARWSGDAFAVLLPRRSHQDTLAVIDCTNKALAKANADPVGPSVSFGCSTKTESPQDIHDVMQTAEMEMHRNKMLEGKAFCDAIIASLVHALGKKDYETEEHTWRMQSLAFKLGGAFGLTDSQFEDLVLAVTLHDVGKIAVPEHVLMKPGPLTSEEWDIIKSHSERGYRIALCSSELAHSAPYILSHHERWDGKGYPQGLKQENIPLISRIISVIDSFDVMVNGRPYRKGLTQQDALSELKRCAGTQFDPRLVEMFIQVLMTQG